MTPSKTLLILDLDETLIRSVEEPLAEVADFKIANYFVYRRPHLREFLLATAEVFDLAIWSAGTEDYVRANAEQLALPGVAFTFIWARERCTERREPETGAYFFQKDLKKLRRMGYPLERVLIVEDIEMNVRAHEGNAIYIKPFYGDMKDFELDKLSVFLRGISNESDVRLIEKRDWSSKS